MDNSGGYYSFNAKPSRGGAAKPLWQQPNKELDPNVAVSKDTFVYLSPLNPLVTDGLVDLTTDELVKAIPGIWQAAQDVPAQDEDDKYNVPQIPYPGAGAAPSGIPLKGDLDGAEVYWILWSQAPICPNV